MPDVPDVEYSIRELVRLCSVGKGQAQGYRKCNCCEKCNSRKCSFKRAGLLCNSVCHAHDASTHILECIIKVDSESPNAKIKNREFARDMAITISGITDGFHFWVRPTMTKIFFYYEH